jgi:hypothetical protein
MICYLKAVFKLVLEMSFIINPLYVWLYYPVLYDTSPCLFQISLITNFINCPGAANSVLSCTLPRKTLFRDHIFFGVPSFETYLYFSVIQIRPNSSLLYL